MTSRQHRSRLATISDSISFTMQQWDTIIPLRILCLFHSLQSGPTSLFTTLRARYVRCGMPQRRTPRLLSSSHAVATPPAAVMTAVSAHSGPGAD